MERERQYWDHREPGVDLPATVRGRGLVRPAVPFRHPADGVGRDCTGGLRGVGHRAGRAARGAGLRRRLHYRPDLGRQQGPVRHPARHLGDHLHVVPRARDRERIRHRHRDLSQRGLPLRLARRSAEGGPPERSAGLDVAAGMDRGHAQDHGRASGCRSERGVRSLGDIRRHPARAATSELAACSPRLASVVRHRAERARHPARHAGPRHHSAADDLRRFPRRAGRGAAEAPRSGLWPRGDPLGGHPRRHHPHRVHRHSRRGHSRLRARPRRNHGARHARRQRQRDQLVDALAREHARRAPGESFPRGGDHRGRRAHVRRPRPPGDHARRERAGNCDRAARRRGPQGVAMTRGPLIQAQEDFSDLAYSLRRPRALFSWVMSVLTGAMTFAALVPLFSVLYLLITRGGKTLGLATFRELPPAALAPGGGFGNAIVGTVVMVAIAALLSVPFGILAAIFTSEFGPDTRTAQAVEFCAKVLTGLPSILAGVFAYAAVVVVTGGFSAPAGGIALGILMLPTVLLTAEEAIKRVPPKMREAAIGMGATPTQVVTRVVLPTALPGVATGVMLAVARAAGETAPLLFTALFSDYWTSPTAHELLPRSRERRVGGGRQ